MFKYRSAMAIDRSKVLIRLSSKSDYIFENICKIFLYPETRKENINEWKKTIARDFSICASYDTKGRIKRKQYEISLLGSFSVNKRDAKALLMDYSDMFERTGYPYIDDSCIEEIADKLFNSCSSIKSDILSIFSNKDRPADCNFYHNIIAKYI